MNYMAVERFVRAEGCIMGFMRFVPSSLYCSMSIPALSPTFRSCEKVCRRWHVRFVNKGFIQQ